MSSQPLTHHEILALIEPFSRLGYQADLVASQRLDRRLVFRPIEHQAESRRSRIVETLVLISRGANALRLERHLAADGGPSVELVADGQDASALLERVRSVPAGAPFQAGPGFCVGFSGRVEVPDGLVALTEAVAHIGQWRMTLEADPVRGMLADVGITHAVQDGAMLPEDLLAVLGRDWGLLRPSGKGWSGTTRLRGRNAARDIRTRERMLIAAHHLAATFAEPATQFHATHHRARRHVMIRRLTPLAAAALLILVGAACTRLDITNDATLRVLLMSSPPVLMILFFSLREVPRLELPPLPRASNAGAWPVLRPSTTQGLTDEC